MYYRRYSLGPLLPKWVSRGFFLLMGFGMFGWMVIGLVRLVKWLVELVMSLF